MCKAAVLPRFVKRLCCRGRAGVGEREHGDGARGAPRRLCGCRAAADARACVKVGGGANSAGGSVCAQCCSRMKLGPTRRRRSATARAPGHGCGGSPGAARRARRRPPPPPARPRGRSASAPPSPGARTHAVSARWRAERRCGAALSQRSPYHCLSRGGRLACSSGSTGLRRARSTSACHSLGRDRPRVRPEGHEAARVTTRSRPRDHTKPPA